MQLGTLIAVNAIPDGFRGTCAETEDATVERRVVAQLLAVMFQRHLR